MPNVLRAGTHRVSYVEESKTSRALGILAAARGVTVSALIREANLEYLKKHDPSGEIMKASEHLADSMTDSASGRVNAEIDQETALALGKILKRFKKK